MYVYNDRWVGSQRFWKIVNVYSIKIVNEGRWVVKIVWKIVNVNCEWPLIMQSHPKLLLNFIITKILKTLDRGVYNLRLQIFTNFWPPTYLRLQFSCYKLLQIFQIFDHPPTQYFNLNLNCEHLLMAPPANWAECMCCAWLSQI